MVCEDCISYDIKIEEHPKTGLPLKAKGVCTFGFLHYKRMTSEGVAECTGFATSVEDWYERYMEARIREELCKGDSLSFKQLTEYLFGEKLDYTVSRHKSYAFYPVGAPKLRGEE